MFFRKNKKIVLNFYTASPQAFNYAKPEKINSFIPNWFKKISSYNPNSNTVNHCPALLSYYKKGLVIPLWSDLKFKMDHKEWKYEFADKKSVIASHSREQWEDCKELKDFNHFKLISPWVADCEEEIEFLWGPPNFLFHDLNVHIVSGVVEYQFNTATHVQFFAKIPEKGNNFEVNLPLGLPLVHIVPLTDRTVEIKTHLVSEEEYKRKYERSLSPFFEKRYFKAKKILKNNKCPYQHEFSKK